jgi:hypothetical protein
LLIDLFFLKMPDIALICQSALCCNMTGIYVCTRPGIQLWITQKAHYPLSYAGQLLLWLQYAIDNLYFTSVQSNWKNSVVNILTASLPSSRSESEWTEAIEGVNSASSGAAGSEAGIFCEGASPYRFFLVAVNCKRQISYFINKNQTGWLRTLFLKSHSSLMNKMKFTCKKEYFFLKKKYSHPHLSVRGSMYNAPWGRTCSLTPTAVRRSSRLYHCHWPDAWSTL